jgi:endoglucanase
MNKSTSSLGAAFVVIGLILIQAAVVRADDTLSLSPATSSPSAPTGSFADLGRGVNIGNYLENPNPGDWSIKFDPNVDFKRIHDAGFSNVRIPLNFSAHVGAAPDFTMQDSYFQKVDQVLDAAKAAGLKIIIDDHNEKDLMDDPEANSARFLAEWKQVAEHYKDQPSTVYFELLNEPIKKMDASHVNEIYAKALPIVRASNPDRTIIVGPCWSYSPAALSYLTLPESDHHLLVTFHFYSPLKFTHQGAAFVEGAMAWLGTKWTGTDEEKREITGGKDGFDKIAVWAKEHNRPVYLGEYGSYLKGDIDSRATWTAFISRTAEANGFSWSYYDYASGFGVCDPDTKEWIKPLQNALTPKS